MNVSDKLHLRHPSTATTTNKAEHVNGMIQTNHCITIRKIASELNISHGSVFTITHD